jgi:hypothetical protein
MDKHLTAAVHESRRIRRVACELEHREQLRELRLAKAFTRRRLTDLRCVRH